MITLAFEPGAAAPIAIRLETDAGEAIDTTGWQFEMRVKLPDRCVVIPSARDPETGEFQIDANSVDLPAFVFGYEAAVYINDGTGWVRQVDGFGEPVKIALNILGGCA